MTKQPKLHPKTRAILEAINEFFQEGNPVYPGALLSDDERTIAEHVAEAIGFVPAPKVTHSYTITGLFTVDDAVEIACCTDLADVIGPDGENLTDDPCYITDDQLQDMKCGVLGKIDRLLEGLYDDDEHKVSDPHSDTGNWLHHMRDILRKLDGVKLNPLNPDPLRHNSLNLS